VAIPRHTVQEHGRLPQRELERRGGQERDVGWQIAGVADLDGDDKSDLV